MPRISEFCGIVIKMYVREHPPPHFHATYGEHYASIAIETGRLISGSLPNPQLRLVRQWLSEHQEELRINWRLVNEQKATKSNRTVAMNKFQLSRVEEVEPLEGLWLRVAFSDGAVMDIGLEGVFGDDPGIFSPVVEDRTFFEQVRVNPQSKVVEWPGELDLDADVMYGKFPPASGPDYQRRIIRLPSPSVA